MGVAGRAGGGGGKVTRGKTIKEGARERRRDRGARKIQRETRKRELRKQINNKAVDFITLLIFAGFDPRTRFALSHLSLPCPQDSPVMLNNTEKKSASGGKGRRGGERMTRTTEDWSFKRRDNHVRLIVPGGFAHSKRIIHPCYFIPINASFYGHIRPTRRSAVSFFFFRTYRSHAGPGFAESK